MVYLVLWLCCHILLSTTVTCDLLFDAKDCEEEDDEFFDSMCELEPHLQHCFTPCKLHVPGEDRMRVPHGSQCRSGSTTLTCSEGHWFSPGQPRHRVKRGGVWFWAKPPKIWCPGDRTVTAATGETSARVDWDSPTFKDPFDAKIRLRRTEGLSPGSRFKEGWTKIRYKASDPNDLSASCYFHVIVKVIYCSDSRRKAFGSMGTQSCSGDKNNIYGSTCYHSCPSGYQLSSSSSVTCQKNGRWSRSFPHCQRVSCRVPSKVTFGLVSCPHGYTYDRKCVLHCTSGYSPTGYTRTTCQSNGRWYPTLNRCTDTQRPRFPQGCPDGPSLFSGPLKSQVTVTWPDPKVTDNSPYSVTLTSDPAKGSKFGVGITTVTVRARDRTGNRASCTFHVNVKARQCPLVHAPANSNMTCTMERVEGSECTFDCNEGHSLQGNSSVTCMETTQWDAEVPMCQVVECPEPPEVEAGSISCSEGRQFRDQCILICDPGYSVIGEVKVRCQADQTWTEAGICVDLEAPHFTIPCPSHLPVFAPRIGQDTIVTWPPVDASDGSGHNVSVLCDVPSGASFPVGNTTVTCEATDASNNSISCQFNVTVTVLQCPHPGSAVNNQSSDVLLTCNDGHVFGANCTLECPAGYSLLGEATLECDRQAETYPPLMTWKGAERKPLSSKPECKEDRCPRLDAPVSGSVSCLWGAEAWDCFLQCHSGWDVSAQFLSFDGYFVCNGQQGLWVPPRVPDCVVRRRPHGLVVYSDLFYVAGPCEDSEDVVKDNLVTRLTTSILKDACVGLPTCTARDVKVTCGPVSGWDRRKRAAVRRTFQSQEERLDSDNVLVIPVAGEQDGARSHYVLVSFEVTLSHLLGNSSWTDTKVFQTTHEVMDSLSRTLQKEAASGRFTLPHVRADVTEMARPSLHVHCPPGTLLRPLHLTADRFSCVGCPKGHYLPQGSSQCQPSVSFRGLSQRSLPAPGILSVSVLSAGPLCSWRRLHVLPALPPRDQHLLPRSLGHGLLSPMD